MTGYIAELDKYGVPASDRICTAAQIKTMIARKDNGNCSNIVEQGNAVLKPYRDRAAAAAAAAAALAKQPKIDMGKCKPAAGISGKGWGCAYVKEQFEGYKTYNIPQNEQLCTAEQATALAFAENEENCGNVVVQANTLIDKYKKIADDAAKAAAAAARAKIDMGNCKASSSFQNKGWNCAALKGQESQFDALSIPAAERICTSFQMDTLVSDRDDGICSNVIQQREAVLKAYRDKAQAAHDAFMGTCKPAKGFENTGFSCAAVDAFLGEAAKYQVPEADRICTPAQAKELVAANNDAACSNVSRQIAAATKRHRDAVAAGQKTGTQTPAPQTTSKQATTTNTTTTQAAVAQNAAGQGAQPGTASKCLRDAYKGSKGWQCRDVLGGWDYVESAFAASSGICSRADAEALVKANNVENCNNLIFSLNAQAQAAAVAPVDGVVNPAKAALEDLKKNFASAADPNGANKAFWTQWNRILNNCNGVKSNSPPNVDRLKNYCGYSGNQLDANKGLYGLTQLVKACKASNCTLDPTKVSYPAN